MDPFDIEAYFQKRDIEDTYIVNRFIKRQKKERKAVHLVVETMSIEIMQRQTKD